MRTTIWAFAKDAERNRTQAAVRISFFIVHSPSKTSPDMDNAPRRKLRCEGLRQRSREAEE